MKVSTRNIKIIKDRLEILNKRFNILPSSEDIRIGDETIFINFPDDESDYTYYNIDDFLRTGTLTPHMARFLEACVQAKLNIIIFIQSHFFIFDYIFRDFFINFDALFARNRFLCKILKLCIFFCQNFHNSLSHAIDAK